MAITFVSSNMIVGHKRSSSLDSGSETVTGVDTFKRSLSARDARPSSSAGSNKVFPKFGKLSGTIEEAGDGESAKESQQLQQQQQNVADSKQLQLRRLESYDDGLITTQPSHDREILAAVLEVKVDLKLEVQRVNQRLAKIEDMLQALMNRLPAASPQQQKSTNNFSTGGNGGSSQNQSGSQPQGGSSCQQGSQATQTSGGSVEQKVSTSTSTSGGEVYREQGTTTERMSSKSQEHHHHHHHHHQSQSDRLKDSDYKTSSREVSKELLERLAQATTSRGEDGTPLGPLILRKRRSKSRNKGAAPLAPLASQPISPSEATETTQMLECTDDREQSAATTDRSERSDRKRPPPRPREVLYGSIRLSDLSNDGEISKECVFSRLRRAFIEKRECELLEGTTDVVREATEKVKMRLDCSLPFFLYY
ncbi:Potassium voltage-gated channel protein eag [Apis cerana cerana]|uniref:Potassium voltage-gated channel protein eag n=1 Tax=Apis cerana cerana TaxID=94128 RepID=A0A2A3EMY9_APICC|nr:Potassium voltage-gated channel protein eag [Apis cerana cerana]